ncbi:hypothetical protein LZ906_017555 (plasmid) [Paraclostridium ghonii]|uniref:hypothetical protein n=1 Tax=Paraclostridium ghonii TaxID=29358 RepID=UPI00202D00FF|nr:hypothetical protein [Paeniclostridium ghonii]MCM0166535.1 hypothetical protein [Paeniclostridium ghonii]
MSRVVLTFKNNEKEKAIEKFLDSKLSASGYIKELVWEVMNKNDIEREFIFSEKNEQVDDPAEGFNFDLDN